MGEESPQAGALGLRLAALRERANLRQADVAKKAKISPASLSRVEAGEREPRADEVTAIIAAINTGEARELEWILQRDWRLLEAPALDHSDHAILWAAEEALLRLDALAASDDVRPAFAKRLNEYYKEIWTLAGLLINRNHDIAFMGAIGVGKSTAICRGSGLMTSAPGGTLVPVLETGGGGVTICEVHLEVGPRFGIIVTPRTAEEIRADVADFAEQLIARVSNESGKLENPQTISAVPLEIDRAIRNMSGLRQARGKSEDGKRIAIDPALDLARQADSTRDLVVEILSLMELPRRDRRSIWSDVVPFSASLEWIRDVFEQINNGRHPEFSLPARIELIVPKLIESGELSIDLIDTRGIDQLTARADLEDRLSDAHTVSILCSGFNDAPEQSIQHLLRRAQEAQISQVDTHSAVMVLPRPAEAMSVKDEGGFPVDTEEEGCELKSEQVSNALAPYGLADLPVHFYNSFSDPAHSFQAFLIERVERTRDTFRTRLREAIAAATFSIDNLEQQQVLQGQREVSRQLAIWLQGNAEPQIGSSRVHDALISEILSAHASTLNAAFKRGGEWYSLSYSHQLGFGARRIAVLALRDWRAEFNAICRNLMSSHSEASDLVTQAMYVMDEAYDALLGKMQVAGAALYRADLRRAEELWDNLREYWGLGEGYRRDVARVQYDWFDGEAQMAIEREISAILAKEWQGVRTRVAAILDETE